MMLLERKYRQMFYFWLQWTRERRLRYQKLEHYMQRAARNIEHRKFHTIFLLWYRYTMCQVFE